MNHYTLTEMTPGLTESFTVTVTEEMMRQFCALSGDVSPIHKDEDYAKARGYAGRVVYGMLGASFFSTLAGVYLPGEHCLLHGVECKFAKPIYIGDTLTRDRHRDPRQRGGGRSRDQGRDPQPGRQKGHPRHHQSRAGAVNTYMNKGAYPCPIPT